MIQSNNMSENLPEMLSFTKALALEAGALIKQMRDSGELTRTTKSGTDVLTSADIASEKLIISKIKERFPTHSILSEESASSLSSNADFLKPLWIIDPIDGTRNYAHNHPHCAVSIAWSQGGETKVGVVHTPFANETFYATKSGGAFLNDKPIASRSITELKDTLACTGFAHRDRKLKRYMEIAQLVLTNCAEIRRLGAASLDICWVACGRLDAFYETLNPWDYAAANLVAREAGAITGHIGEIPADLAIPIEFYSEEILVACKGVFDKFREMLRSAPKDAGRHF